MRSLLLIAAVSSAVLCLPVTDAGACGDKFLVVGRGVRVQDQFFQAQGNILVYANRARPESAITDLELEETLVRAGHTYGLVSEESELEEAIAGGTYDVILSDVRDAPLVKSMLERQAVQAAVIPVVFKEDKEELAQAKKEYSSVLKSPARTRYLLAVINDTLVQQEKSTAQGK